MSVNRSKTDFVRRMAIFSVLGLLAVLLYYLPQPGYSQSRLVLFGLIAGAAVLGGVGVVFRSTRVTAVGSIGLFLLGFWQAVLSVYIFPVLALLVTTALLDESEDTLKNSSTRSS